MGLVGRRTVVRGYGASRGRDVSLVQRYWVLFTGIAWFGDILKVGSGEHVPEAPSSQTVDICDVPFPFRFFPPRKRTPTSLLRRVFLMTVRALILVRPAPRHDPFETRPLKPFIPVADLNRSWDEGGTQGLSRATTPGPGFWLRGVDCHSSAARLGSLLAIHRGNRPLQRPRLFTRQPPLSKMGVRQQGRVNRFSRKHDGSSP